MTAKELTIIHGQSLIGRPVETEAIGEYPGGIATVTELAPDPEAPEIVFKVRHPTYGEIGVFEWERVAFVPEAPPDEESTTTTRTQAGADDAQTDPCSPTRKEDHDHNRTRQHHALLPGGRVRQSVSVRH